MTSRITHLKLLLIRQDAPDHVGDVPTQPVQQERQRQSITGLLKVIFHDLRSLGDDPTGDGRVSEERRQELRSEVRKSWKHGELGIGRGEHVGVGLLVEEVYTRWGEGQMGG